MRSFSFLSYAVAVAAGTVTVGVLMALYSVILGGSMYAAYLIFPVAALVYGFIPGAAFFLPVALVGLWVARRVRRISALAAISVGAVGAGAIAAGVSSYAGYPVTIYFVATFACAGGVAALTYYGVRSWQLKLTFGPPRRNNAEWVAEAENHRPGSLEQRSRID